MRPRADIDVITSQIGTNLRHIRRATGLTQKQLAEKLGVSFQQVQKYETGKNRISAATLYKLAQILDVPYDAFFENIEPNSKRVESTPSLYTICVNENALELFQRFKSIKNKALQKKAKEILRIMAQQP